MRRLSLLSCAFASLVACSSQKGPESATGNQAGTSATPNGGTSGTTASTGGSDDAGGSLDAGGATSRAGSATGGTKSAGGAMGTGGSQAGGGTGGAKFGSGGAGGVTGTQVLIDGSKVDQTMDGFGASINPHSWDDGAVKPALALLDTMGVRIWRVCYDMMDWEATNDDDDPANFNWTSYNAIFSSPDFEELWSTIGYLNDKGYASTVILDFMGRVPPWMGGAALTPSLKDEFVETVVAAAYYGRITRGLKFGVLAPANETDWDGIEGPQIAADDYGDVMNRIAVRLDAIPGLADLKLIGPDTAMGQAASDTYIPAMMSHPKLMAHVNTFSIHEYGPTTHGLMKTISGSKFADAHGWVAETSEVFDAFVHLQEGVSSVLLWEGFDSVFQHAILAGRGTTPPNDAGPMPAALSFTDGKYAPRPGTYAQWEQLFRFVAPGAQRIEAKSSVNGVDVLAFNHPVTGQLTIIGHNTAGDQKLSIGLQFLADIPAAFTVYATSSGSDFAKLADAKVVSGKTSLTVPDDSIFTLTATP